MRRNITVMAATTSEKVYYALVRRSEDGEDDLPSYVAENVAPNGLRLIAANTLQSSGDQIVNASTVLPWLFSVLGVPSALTGLLVPIRQSGSMLPQAFITPLVVQVKKRKWVFVAGALVQASAVALMAATAALGQGFGAGLIIIAALVIFSLGRSLGSISSKDVQGRIIPKGERGQLNGLATTASGVVAITLGVGIRLVGGDDLSAVALAWLLAGGAALWVAVAAVYATIREPSEEKISPDHGPTTATATEGKIGESTTGESTAGESTAGGSANWFLQTFRMLRDDTAFRKFVAVRSLLLVSSLSPPFIVTLSIEAGAGSLAGLGGFVVASGFASVIGGRLFGRFADRSSKKLMAVGAGVASTIILVTVLLIVLVDSADEGWLGNLLFVAAYFGLTLMHTGVRVGRKTYVVDMAEGDLRTTYVAVSNSAMGLILLVVGALTSALAAVSILWALVALAAMGFAGVLGGLRLPDVSQKI